jgi:hypothetical protein
MFMELTEDIQSNAPRAASDFRTIIAKFVNESEDDIVD